MKFALIFLFLPIFLYSFPELMNKRGNFNKINLKVVVKNPTIAKIDAPLFASISAISDNFIIKSFKAENTSSPLIFKNVKLYPSARFYELAVSYKGVNYFKKYKVNELQKLQKEGFEVYEQGNIKDNIKIEKFDYIIEIDERNKIIRLTEDLVVKNDGNFTYSPLLPQDAPGIKIPLYKGIKSINPVFNLSNNNYEIEDNYIKLKVFLRPGRNYFTFNYFIRLKKFPAVLRFKTLNNVELTRVILPDAKNKITSNVISGFIIRETDEGAVKIGVKKNIKKGTDLNFKITGKPEFKKGLITSSVNLYKKIKKADKFIGYGGVIFLIVSLLYILFFMKSLPKDTV